MELYLNATSPYARLVRIVLLEKGLADAVTLKWCDPWADDAELLKTLNQKTQPGDIIVFLGSHGFRGMIDELITRNAE